MSRPAVLLVRPPNRLGDLVRITNCQHPINLLSLCAYLREHGYDPRLLDYEVDPYTPERFRAAIEEARPLWIGVSCFTPTILLGHSLLEVARDAFPEIPRVVGGPHPTALPRRTLEEFPAFDVAVEGEAEETVLEMSERLRRGRDLSGVAGLAWKRGDAIVQERERPRIDDLDRLPFPARDLLDLRKYPGAVKSGLAAGLYRSTQLSTSRGCPFPCTFCAISLTTSRKVRFRSPGNVRAELRECRERFGLEHVTIHDDTFTVKASRVREIATVLREEGFTWDCDTRVDSVTEEMLREMGRSGCLRVAFGVESGSERMLRAMRKQVTVPQIRNAFRWAREAGIRTSAYFILGGHPDETREDVEATRRLMREIEADFVNVAIGTPYPGTELYDQMAERGLLLEDRWERYLFYNALPAWRTVHFSPEDLVRLQADLIRGYFYRPSFVWKRLRAVESLGELVYYLRSAWIGLKYVVRGSVLYSH